MSDKEDLNKIPESSLLPLEHLFESSICGDVGKLSSYGIVQLEIVICPSIY